MNTMKGGRSRGREYTGKTTEQRIIQQNKKSRGAEREAVYFHDFIALVNI